MKTNQIRKKEPRYEPLNNLIGDSTEQKSQNQINAIIHDFSWFMATFSKYFNKRLVRTSDSEGLVSTLVLKPKI